MTAGRSNANQSAACVDLHTHSTASDGFDSPEELVKNAIAAKLSALALTDHDAVSGIFPAQRAAEGTGLDVIPGIELSTESHGADLHILGYFIDSSSTELLTTLEWLVSKRIERVTRICDRLQGLGYAVPVEDVLDLAGTGTVGRPHVARVMIDRGYVTSIGQAFAQFLARGKPGYASVDKLTPHQAIELIRAAGGVPVLAHPMTAGDLTQVVPELKRAGLLGLEVWYGEYDRRTCQLLTDLAAKHQLLETGGSDYHGLPIKPNRPLGVPCIHSQVLTNLRTAAPSQR